MTRIRVYLVRHAEAEPASAGEDSARRLTAEGRTRFTALLRALRPELDVSRTLSSPLARARETAALLAAATGATVEDEPALACGRCTGPDLLALAEWAGAGAALVGHNPEVAEAVALLSKADRAVPPGTVAAIDAGEGQFELAWVREP